MKNGNSIITGDIYRTTDYSLFKRLEGNRAVLASRVTKITKSIKTNGYIFNPIIVNEHYQVIDGQGRLEALRILGLPVDYVIAEGAGREQCIALNAYGTVWTMKDYIDSYCEDGNENYIRMREVINEFPDIGIAIKIMLISGLSSVPNKSIKEGTVTVTEKMAQQARDDLLFAQRFAETFERVKGSPIHYVYTVVFAKKCGADTSRLIDTIEKENLPPAPKLRTAMDAVSDIYNKNLKNQTKKIYLHKEYEETMANKYGWYGAKWGTRDE